MGYRYPPLKTTTNAINLEVFDSLGEFLGYKNIHLCNKVLFLADYLQKFQPKKRDTIFGYLDPGRNSFQHQNLVHISVIDKSQQSHVKYFPIIATTILLVSVFFSIRHCIKATWQNDRDQFYAPYDDAFQDDSEFKNNCLIFMLFHTQNRITTTQGTNHFIPFSETEVNAKERYSSHALLDFLKGGIKEEGDSLFLNAKKENKPLEFSLCASRVFDAGSEIYRYYHTQDPTNRPYNANASLYDIKEFFQGRNAQGKLNLPAKAKDEHYKQLYANLQDALKDLAKEIQPKVYEYGFLRE
ncbi:nucleoside 5-triphosphatase RdgB (dHAPTP, dITP,XTP-specific) [Helicobacter pylori]|nr:nucleoside 5-triphosphatase RdgB (dHAPTP, dITP,XTP-specific) [Helicobacter pylori]